MACRPFSGPSAGVLTMASGWSSSGKKKGYMKILILFTTLLAWFAPASAQIKADLSRLVVLGDSLSAGYQNDSLLSTQQVHGYGNLLAEQAGVTLSLPLIAPP